jgi:predicted transcriptional regulator
MRHQFVLDKRSKQILDDLAQYRGGNRSLVVREALVTLADMEARIDKVETDPAFQKMMADSEKAIREGRVTPHEVVVKMAHAKRKRRK